jgi:hypothetical protein
VRRLRVWWLRWLERLESVGCEGTDDPDGLRAELWTVNVIVAMDPLRTDLDPYATWEDDRD